MELSSINPLEPEILTKVLDRLACAVNGESKIGGPRMVPGRSDGVPERKRPIG